MTSTSPLVMRILGRPTQQERDGDEGGCPHCRSGQPAWSTGLWRDGGPWVCTNCGGISGGHGEALIVSTRSGRLVAPDGADPAADLAPPDAVPDPRRLTEALSQIHRQVDGADLSSYLRQVALGLEDRPDRRMILIDLGEPSIAALGAGVLVASLGLLATLEDEAQLAFILAREIALEEGGSPRRRFATAASAPAPRFAWLRKGPDPLCEAVEMSLRVGYGPEIEAEADRLALERMRAADYDIGSAPAALRLLEASQLAGRGGRFLLAAERAERIARANNQTQELGTGRLNREVYRRAVGGFRVFER